MKMDHVQRLARLLRGLVLAALAVNLFSMLLAPGLAELLAHGGPEAVRRYLAYSLSDGDQAHNMGRLLFFFLHCLWEVWADWYTAALTLFYWMCSVCTATILWQAKLVLDTILSGEPFQRSNASALKRAAIACWTIAAGALVRELLWLLAAGNVAPLFTYNALFIPAFGMAGLLFLVMSALFRQAAELKEDQELTI